MKASRIAILALAVASLVLATDGVAFAAKAPPDPHTVGATTLSTIALDGKVGTKFTVTEGEPLKVSADWSDGNAGCPSCKDYVAVAFAGQPAAGCIEDFGIYEQDGNGEVDLGPAPKAGTYDIVASFEEVRNCGEYWNAADSTSYPVLMQVKVKKPVAHKAKAPFQEGNSYCGANDAELPVVGTAALSRLGNELTVSATLKHGVPNSTYEVEVWGNECDYLATAFELTTNSKGIGKGKGTIDVPEGDTEFFVDPFTLSVGNNDTPYVTLPY
ncbi:MAG TPA: hypothetical protein VMB51_02935 [Solirubrobacteraceae bacterium]|nr:hypothetical protein [Solirubrobacteraceae bacterium]